MAVINLGLLNWLFNRSPQNAANPQVPQNASPEIPDPDVNPIESSAETDSTTYLQLIWSKL